MKLSTILYLAVGTLGILCYTSGAEKEVAEYKRLGSCNFTQECFYKYRTVQYTLGEKDREKIYFSTDIYWHCDSSGSFGILPANEYCFTLSNVNVTASAGFNSSLHNTSNDQNKMADILNKRLKGEFCYVQTSNGKIVSIHYSPTESEEGINIKRGITGAFQANFDNQKEVEESDPGSTHLSHYSFLKTSSNVTSFIRTFNTSDLMDIVGGASKDSLNYNKTEKSVFINNILYKSQGMLKARLGSKLGFGDGQTSKSLNDTSNLNFNFGKGFEANGSYILERIYCKQKSKRSLIFADLASTNIQKGSIKATIDLTNFHQYKMGKIRNDIISIPGFLEKIRRNPNNTVLVDKLQDLLRLEAIYGSPSNSPPTLNQLINYYKQIQASNKLQDVEIRKIIYKLFSVDGSKQSQKVLGSALRKHLNEDERSALLYQLMLIKNASLDLVNIVNNSISNSDDNDLILVLGALARDNNLSIQKVVVDELLKRLNTVLSSDNIGAVTTIIYALGNSASKLAISSLLSTLQNDDIDIQIATIRSLEFHLDQPVVQQAIISLLLSTNEDNILEEILKVLLNAFEDRILTSPSKELMDAIVNSAIKLQNPNLYELTMNYLYQLKTDDIDIYLDMLKQQQNYGDFQHDHSDSRVKRGSDWDEYNSDYNMVASYYDRRSDVSNYPSHKAYIWRKNLGTGDINMRVGVGAFSGMTVNSQSMSYKQFAKAAASAYVYGSTYSIATLQTSMSTSGYHLYVKLGNGVRINTNLRINVNVNTNTKSDSDCRSRYSSSSITILNTEISFYVYVSSLYVGLSGSASFSINNKMCACISYPPPTAKGSAQLTLSFGLRVTGDTYTSLAAYRVGIEVSASYSYSVSPDLRIEGTLAQPSLSSFISKCSIPTSNIKHCSSLYHDWSAYGSIDPWYQKLYTTIEYSGWLGLETTIKTYWGDKTKCCSSVSSNWDSSSYGRSLLWSSCTSTIKTCT